MVPITRLLLFNLFFCEKNEGFYLMGALLLLAEASSLVSAKRAYAMEKEGCFFMLEYVSISE